MCIKATLVGKFSRKKKTDTDFKLSFLFVFSGHGARHCDCSFGSFKIFLKSTCSFDEYGSLSKTSVP